MKTETHWRNKPYLRVGCMPSLDDQHKTNSTASLEVLCLIMSNIKKKNNKKKTPKLYRAFAYVSCLLFLCFYGLSACANVCFCVSVYSLCFWLFLMFGSFVIFKFVCFLFCFILFYCIIIPLIPIF